MRQLCLRSVLPFVIVSLTCCRAATPTNLRVAANLTLSTTRLVFSSLGETVQLTATVTDENAGTIGSAQVAWASSDPSVASVSEDGLVTAVSEGTAEVVATYGVAADTAFVAVEQVVASIELSSDSIVLAGPGDTEIVEASALDGGGSEIAAADIEWSSDDEEIATVSGTGLVMGVASGSTTITVVASRGGQAVTRELTITVEDAALGTPAGGVVSLADGAVSMLLPAGAVRDSVFMTAALATGLPPGPIPGTGFDLGPDGLAFYEPVELTIAYDPSRVPPGVSEQELRIHKFVAGEYVLMDAGVTDVVDNTVSGVIGGLSVYAVLPRLSVTTTSLPDGVQNVDYGPESLGAIGGIGGYSWALAGGSGLLPTGLTLATNGDIEGTPAAPGTWSFTVEVTSGGQTAQQPLSIHVTEPTESFEILVGAGDIARCDLEGDEATADLLDGLSGTVFTLGDNAYEDGTDAEFADCYDPSWGWHKDRTRPSVGNHEYHTPDAAGYYGYFGASAGDPASGYYSYDLGAWHIIVLNSNIQTDAGSPQLQWLASDLADNPSTCTLAYWHHPRFSSGMHGDSPAMKPFWDTLHAAGADVVLAGHDHDYERFAPQDPDGVADPTTGIRQFVVGTGGAPLRPFESVASNSEVRDHSTWGVLELTLYSSHYEWEFVPTEGSAFSDSGSAGCH